MRNYYSLFKKYLFSFLSVRNLSANKNTSTKILTEEEYYESMFVYNNSWNKPTPNYEETLRWSIIERFVIYAKSNLQKEMLSILDVGCGRGWLTNLLNAHGVAKGIEPIKPVVEFARNLFPHIEIRNTSLEDIADEASFEMHDLVVCSEVIEHVPDYQKLEFIRKLKKLLKKQGFLIITTPRKEVLREWLKYTNPSQPIEDWMDEQTVQKYFEGENFKVHKIERFSLKPSEKAPHIDIYQLWLFQIK